MEAQPPGAQIHGGGRLVEELAAGANDDEMDDERAAGPHPRGQRSRPQRGKKADGEHEQQNHQRSRQPVLRELAQQLVVEDRARAAGRRQPVARFPHVPCGKAALG
jgi:hypothetical protein